uniref:SCP domain-containing protein n=1 Tax=Steinernema glaseri TaxID=37863 RepID=A0A1I8AHT8_9BILA
MHENRLMNRSTRVFNWSFQLCKKMAGEGNNSAAMTVIRSTLLRRHAFNINRFDKHPVECRRSGALTCKAGYICHQHGSSLRASDIKLFYVCY